MADDAYQFRSKPERLAGVVPVPRSERVEKLGGNQMRVRRQLAIYLRDHAMVIYQREQSFPVEPMREKCADPFGARYVLAAGKK